MAAMGVYAITHVETGRQYIGSAIDLKSRWRIHRCELSKGRHHNIKLQNAWNKYGAHAFAFSVLETVADAAELIPAEQRWLDTAKPHYNLLPKAGSILGSKRTAETIAKMRRAGLQQNHRRGSTPTPEWRAKQRAAHLGKPMPAAARRKASATWLERLSVRRLAAEAGIEGAVLGIREAAPLCGYERTGLLKLIRQGVVPATRLGRVWVIRRADFDMLLPGRIERRRHRQCRAFQGERHYAARLAAPDVRCIRQDYDERTASIKQLAERYGVHPATIWSIVHRKTWRHLVD